MNTLFCFLCLRLYTSVVYRVMHVRNYADIERKKNTMKLLPLNEITQKTLSMSNEDLKQLINDQEDSNLWIHSILAKRFMHLINKGIQEEWLELNGEYVRVSF